MGLNEKWGLVKVKLIKKIITIGEIVIKRHKIHESVHLDKYLTH